MSGAAQLETRTLSFHRDEKQRTDDDAVPRSPAQPVTPSPPTFAGSVGELAARLAGASSESRRFLLGVAGEPGAGKSTVAARLAAALGVGAVVVPFDGFHLASTLLVTEELRNRRGAIETFDLTGFRVLIQRLRQAAESVVYAPAYVREIEEPIAAAIAIPGSASIVIVEGNYLLSDDPELRTARSMLDEAWYIDVDAETRRRRLVDRHIRFGKSPEAARDWVEGSDEANAGAIRATRERADLVVRIREDLSSFDKPSG
jgi:pantothenate kinase